MNTIAVLYEHPEWFKPLFAEMDRRGLDYERLDAARLLFGPRPETPYRLVVNRMSPSAYLRGAAHAIFATRDYLATLKQLGVPTINGFDAFSVEISKATQLALLEKLRLRYPRTRIINRTDLAPAAAEGLRFPVLLKPNLGGSGAGIRKFETRDALAEAARLGELQLGLDHTALVQEALPAAGGHIVRVEVLGGRFLYAIRVYPRPDAGFNLCPADICASPSSAPGPQALTPEAARRALGADACPAEAPKLGLRVEGYRPPDRVIDEVLAIARAAHLDVGGIEYMVDERDGDVYYYDINALSNFVSDASRVVGFDPFVNFVDYIEARRRALAA